MDLLRFYNIIGRLKIYKYYVKNNLNSIYTIYWLGIFILGKNRFLSYQKTFKFLLNFFIFDQILNPLILP